VVVPPHAWEANDAPRAGKKYRLALEVMEFHDVFFPAVQYACDNAVVCDDMDAARYGCWLCWVGRGAAL